GRNEPGDNIQIFVEESSIGDAPVPDYVATVLDGDFAEIFLRLQHTCIKKFNFGIRDSAFMRYWKAQENVAFTVVRIDFRLTDETDYGVLDSVVNHLRPRTTAEVDVEEYLWYDTGYNRDKAKKRLELLARESFVNNLQSCSLDEPGYPNYELFGMCGGQIVDGIDDFIESFVRNGCTNYKLESVCVVWFGYEWQHSPTLMQLSKSTKIDVPLPKNDLTALFSRFVYTECEVRSFVNKKHWKRMEVYKWSVECDDGHGGLTGQVLQCRVKSL
ncbi:hypothetical protein AAVH_30786, partial [Aphelenchoides avenae]